MVLDTARNDHVGVDIDDLQGRGDAFQCGELFHRTYFPAELKGQGPLILSRIWPRQKANLRNPTLLLSCSYSVSASNRLHIGIRQAEMVADFVNQDVADDMAQRFLIVRPSSRGSGGGTADHVG